jgi:hypothetical protein
MDIGPAKGLRSYCKLAEVLLGSVERCAGGRNAPSCWNSRRPSSAQRRSLIKNNLIWAQSSLYFSSCVIALHLSVRPLLA